MRWRAVKRHVRSTCRRLQRWLRKFLKVVLGCRRWYAIQTVARRAWDVVVKCVVRIVGDRELVGTRAQTAAVWDVMAL